MSGVCVVGALNLDLVAHVAELPRRGQTVMAAGLTRHAGGKGLNQAVAAARAGAPTRMLGRVGRDEAGDWLLGVLGGAGVDGGVIARDAHAPTGQALITVDGHGENCIVVAAGANLSLTAEDADAAHVSGCSVLLSQLETAVEPVAALFARPLPGCLKMLNAAPALPQGAALFGHCDLLILNETELAAYAGLDSAPVALDALAVAARSLLRRGDQRAVVTLGERGALATGRDGDIYAAARRARVVDTVGAGDCFCGVLAAGLCEGLDLRSALPRSVAAASLAVERRGAAEAMPSRPEIDAACRA